MARVRKTFATEVGDRFGPAAGGFAPDSEDRFPALRAPGASEKSLLSYAQSKHVRNLYLTRERDRRRGRELATFLLAGLPIACALLLYAALHVETVRVGYAREARARRAAELMEENRRLKAELARASTPERVSAVAARKGLAPPRPGQVQYIEVGPGAERVDEEPSASRRGKPPASRGEAN